MFTERGYLRVKTTTGRGSIPLENVQVTVSCYKNGEYHLAGSFLTDSSGQTEIITLQAPPKSTSEKPDINCEIISLEVEKAYTDTFHCVMEAVDRGYNEVQIFCAIGCF